MENFNVLKLLNLESIKDVQRVQKGAPALHCLYYQVFH
jgi:hypothetical protein